jgi:hypothetical protein
VRACFIVNRSIFPKSRGLILRNWWNKPNHLPNLLCFLPSPHNSFLDRPFLDPKIWEEIWEIVLHFQIKIGPRNSQKFCVRRRDFGENAPIDEGARTHARQISPLVSLICLIPPVCPIFPDFPDFPNFPGFSDFSNFSDFSDFLWFSLISLISRINSAAFPLSFISHHPALSSSTKMQLRLKGRHPLEGATVYRQFCA